jgi:hypothetical protein
MRLSIGLACAVLTTLVCATARAQAPRINPHGDPSVRDDTIYRLAVDSAAYPQQATVLLFDDCVIRVGAMNRVTRVWRQVTQVLRPAGVAGLQERVFTYTPELQRVTINWIRVLRPDGTVISSGPAQEQETDEAPVAGSVVKWHRRVRRLSLSGVAPGTLVDVSWSAEDREALRDGDFFLRWFVSDGTTVRRSRLLIDVPDDIQLRIAERNLTFRRRESTAGDRTIYEWATNDVPWVRQEPLVSPADSVDPGMSVTVSTPGSWLDVGSWYAGVARVALVPTRALRDTVERVVARAGSREDAIKAVQEWVVETIRSVAQSFGVGGYAPRSPDVVVSSGFGDSKDKATLLVAALGAIGVDAAPVLINTVRPIAHDLPSILVFNHAIVAIRDRSGYRFVDPTAEVPLGVLPDDDQGQFGLIVRTDGRSEEVTTPEDSASANGSELRVAGVIDSSGAFRGRLVWRAFGSGAVLLRAMVTSGFDSAQLASVLANSVAGMFPGEARSDSLGTFDGEDLYAEPRVTFVMRGKAVLRSGTTDVLTFADGSDKWTRMANLLEAELPRQLPIDASRIIGVRTEVEESRFTMPAVWRAELPRDVSATSVFGSYSARYRQEGRDLVISRRTVGARGIQSKEHIQELIAWVRAIAKDRVPFIVLDHP